MRVMVDDLPFTLRAYRRLTKVVAPLANRFIQQRLKRGKEDAIRATERKGISSIARPEGPLIWIHGASVGEILAVAALIERISAMSIPILLTSGTRTSAEIAVQRFPDVIHQFLPYDCPVFVNRFLDYWRPGISLFVESDLWPNLLLAGADRGMPMIIVNGRMSERSFRRWQWVPTTMNALLGRFEMCLAQSAGDAERFTALGSPHVFTTGNLKLDSPVPPVDEDRMDEMTAATDGRPIVVAASTHPGEEDILADAHTSLVQRFPDLLTVIVPRHPQRGAALANDIRARGFRTALRSAGELPSRETDIYIADTLGELGLFYRLSPVVFVGGSLVNHGGQNPIEAVQLGAAVVHGPHVFNFKDVYQALDDKAASVEVADGAALAAQFAEWLTNDDMRQRASNAGRIVVDDLSGALRRTLTALEPYLLQLRLERKASHA
jgi:3-deoxy-D-manno-octulosonic-acid transferase